MPTFVEPTDSTRRCWQMVNTQIAARNIRDARVIHAFLTVPRDAFVPRALEEHAYDDMPLPCGSGQTISQPYVVALTAEALELSPGDRVLEVGTGSGYGAAILGELAREVYTIERIGALALLARERLRALGYGNVHVIESDGTLGWPPGAPYQAIAVTAAGPVVPEALLRQLAIGGRLVIPIGQAGTQRLIRIVRTGEHDYSERDLGAVSFVPLIGAQGCDEHAGVGQDDAA